MSARLSLVLIACGLSGAAAAAALGIGRDATPDEIAGWNSDVRPDGAGLPAGSGSVTQGEAVFQAQCSACHSASGKGGTAPSLAGGIGSLASAHPERTVGSYWPYATTLFDYVHRAMPFNAPHSLSDDQVYAVTAYVLHLNGIVPADAVMDPQTLPQVQMPNRNGFHSVWRDPS